MSALQSALAEIRTSADTGSSAGLLADECAALTAEIDRLTAAAAGSATEFGVRHRDGSVSSFVDGRLARIVSREPGCSLVKRPVGSWEDADESEIAPDLDALAMTRQAPREFDPCLIRFERRGQEIWANFFDRGGQATGTSTHQGDATMAGLIAYYEHRGWTVAEPIEAESGAER